MDKRTGAGCWLGGSSLLTCSLFTLALTMVLVAVACGGTESAPDTPTPSYTGEAESVQGTPASSYTGEQDAVQDTTAGSATPDVEAPDPEEAQTGDDDSAVLIMSDLIPEFHGAGTLSLEARIYDSDVVVRASWVSAANGVLRFRAIEYLKGTGATNFSVRATTDGRNTEWDTREAILFLILPESGTTTRSSESPTVEFLFTETDKYYTGQLPEGYMIGTRNPVWIPSNTAPSTTTKSTDTTTTSTEGKSTASTAFIIDSQSPLGVASPTVSLADLRAKIAWVEGGANIAGYDDCIEYSLDYLRYHRDFETYHGREWEPYEIEKRVTSGAGEGTVISDFGLYRGESAYGTSWLTGDDAGLFSTEVVDDDGIASNGYRNDIATARPLPSGTYRFRMRARTPEFFPCDFHPVNYGANWVVTVVASESTVHEAFFDPVNLTPGVGFSPTSGVLKPAAFSIGGTSTSITGLKWASNAVVMTLSPYVSLSGQTVDFIELDGSIGLSLSASSATADSTAGTLTWTVTEQPWEDGDQLMLRIGVPPPAISLNDVAEP